MSASDQLPPHEAASRLSEACARNLSVELHRAADTGQVLVARARMLAMDQEQIVLDGVQNSQHAVPLSAGMSIDAFFHLGEVRYTFETKIKRARCMVQLNAEKRVTGMTLDRPGNLAIGQRRESYRVSLAAIGGIEATARIADGPQPPSSVPRVCSVFGEFIEISVGGASLLLNASHQSTMKSGQHLFVNFSIANEESEGGGDHDLHFLAEIRHIRPVADGTAIRLGLMYVHDWPTHVIFRRQTDLLQRFITRLQREALRRAG